MVRVVVVGERTGFRTGARTLLSSDGVRHLVADCDDPDGAAAMVEATAAEVVVVDVDGLGRARAVAVAEDLARRAPGVAVILLSLGEIEPAAGK